MSLAPCRIGTNVGRGQWVVERPFSCKFPQVGTVGILSKVHRLRDGNAEFLVGREIIRCCGLAQNANKPVLSLQELKQSILQSLGGLNRGIFGVTSAKKDELEGYLRSLEDMNTSCKPTENLDKVKGEWRLLYSTINILGVKRTKLGLRDFVTLGDFLQIIDVDERKAVNRVGFTVTGLGMLRGALTIEASFAVVSPSRVNIRFENSRIVPDQLLNLFKKNYELLLSIFNPEGWLEITYVDEEWRIGRDDKGHVFLVERVPATS